MLLQDCGILFVYLQMVMFMHLGGISLDSWVLEPIKLRYTIYSSATEFIAFFLFKVRKNYGVFMLDFNATKHMMVWFTFDIVSLFFTMTLL